MPQHSEAPSHITNFTTPEEERRHIRVHIRFMQQAIKHPNVAVPKSVFLANIRFQRAKLRLLEKSETIV